MIAIYISSTLTFNNCVPFRFEELLKEERTYRQELTAYEKKIENWTLTVKTDSRLPTATNVKVCLSLI